MSLDLSAPSNVIVQPAQGPSLMAPRLVRAPAFERRSAGVLLLILLSGVVALTLVPWQQTSYGTGRVVAYTAVEREQVVQAPISGRIIHWAVQEGARVRKGDRIVDIADNDPEILDRLRQQRDAARAEVTAKQTAIQAYEAQIAAMRNARGLSISAAQARARMATQHARAAEQSLAAAEAGLRTATLNHDRQLALSERGLASTRAVELAELGRTKAETDKLSAAARLEAARGEVFARRADVSSMEADYEAKIAKIEAERQASQADLAKAQSGLTKVEGRLARQAQMVVRATRDGSVARVIARQGAAFVKEGDPLLVFVPDTNARAVELWIDGNDVPLVTPGRTARLQFEGWPAVQFSGWPSVAVGTFGGRVAFVDAMADAQGRFRVVIVPDGEGWPEARYLRQGARSHGWIMLNTVRLGFEVWRRINGFPPTSDQPPSVGEVKGGKKASGAGDAAKR